MSEKELTDKNSMTQQDDYQTQAQTLREALTGLSKVQLPFQEDSEVEASKPSQTTGFRESIMQKAMERHPDLTQEEAEEMMKELGA